AKDGLDVDVVQAIFDAGENGIVSIEHVEGDSSTVEKIDHMVIQQGAIHPEFVSLRPEQRCVLDDCAILLCARKISLMRELIPILAVVAAEGKPLLIVAEDVEGEALTTLLVNLKRGVLRSIAIRSGYEHRRAGFLQDLAVLTGGTVIDPNVDIRLQ